MDTGLGVLESTTVVLFIIAAIRPRIRQPSADDVGTIHNSIMFYVILHAFTRELQNLMKDIDAEQCETDSIGIRWEWPDPSTRFGWYL